MDEMVELFVVMIGLGIVASLLVIPVILLIRVSGLCRGMRELQQQLTRLEGRLVESAKPDIPVADATPESVPVAAASVSDAEPEPVPPPMPQQPCAESALSADSAPPSVPREPNAVERAMSQIWNWFIIGEAYRKPGESWEYAAATHWLLRTGILIVLGSGQRCVQASHAVTLQIQGHVPETCCFHGRHHGFAKRLIQQPG
jgi:hypothetical protein